MKTVRLRDGVVVEIIPDYATPVEKWYGVDFAVQCVEAPDEVQPGWSYDGNIFTEPSPASPVQEPTAQDDIDAMLVDHEYRLTLLELGLAE